MGLPQSIPLEQALPDEALPDDIAPERALIELLECKSEDVLRLRSDLGLHPLAAQVLARRGLGEPEAVRAFLAAEELHAPELLPGASAVADSIASHIARGSRIAVHGDYDVDGVCSTAIFVRTLTKLGADVTWHVPSRFEDGYGLSRAAIDRLGRDGVDLMIAVDCGVTAVNETAYAKAQGMDVVICDHHKSDDTLPDALIAHPALGDYPFPDLCAAAVAYKVCQLVAERTGGDAAALQDDLELVGLATVCDVMPLSGENRTLVRRGIAAMRQTMRPGLRELMRSSAVDQLKVDAGAFGFRLGPRINAAGRMFSAEPAVELLLTTSEQRAAELAAQLGSANSRRQEIEQTILFQAETQARRQRDEFAIVVAGDDWHGGVLGIVAGRIAERFRRPCIALGIEGGVAKGSGRSGGVYDLHSGLTACSSHLTRFGGHKAAAGVELEETAINAFRVALQAHAREHLTADDLRPRVRVDAVADPSQLSLEAVEALEQLGPFGMG
ncbi:MAG TPA: single-stranded-DNA-specific exonuclease RecJ, partial [Solirubrobacterales bacterium]|nr:single-stranded-DNA-specific exonuclease RecJ [Solirubrobacterales bacterium]